MPPLPRQLVAASPICFRQMLTQQMHPCTHVGVHLPISTPAPICPPTRCSPASPIQIHACAYLHTLSRSSPPACLASPTCFLLAHAHASAPAIAPAKHTTLHRSASLPAFTWIQASVGVGPCYPSPHTLAPLGSGLPRTLLPITLHPKPHLDPDFLGPCYPSPYTLAPLGSELPRTLLPLTLHPSPTWIRTT